jgi:hypothetical protein
VINEKGSTLSNAFGPGNNKALPLHPNLSIGGQIPCSHIILSWHLPGKKVKSWKSSARIAELRAKFQNWNFQNMKQECCHSIAMFDVFFYTLSKQMHAIAPNSKSLSAYYAAACFTYLSWWFSLRVVMWCGTGGNQLKGHNGIQA